MINKITNIIKEEIDNLTLNTYRVFHGTNDKFEDFDINKTTEGIIWFTDDIESIKNNEHGGMGNKYILTRTITLNNPAGWDEYENLMLGQIIERGYDGIILPRDSSGDKNDYIVFDKKSIGKDINKIKIK